MELIIQASHSNADAAALMYVRNFMHERAIHKKEITLIHVQ